MILVTVGTYERDFNRLLKAVDDLLAKSVIKEKVVMQIGYSTYLPKKAEWFRFKSFDEMKRTMQKSDLIICQGGTGTIFTALNLGKKIVAVPRLKKFREVVDDHQLQIIREFEKEGRIIAAYRTEDLKEAIQKAKKLKVISKKEKVEMVGIISEFLRKLERN